MQYVRGCCNGEKIIEENYCSRRWKSIWSIWTLCFGHFDRTNRYTIMCTESVQRVCFIALQKMTLQSKMGSILDTRSENEKIKAQKTIKTRKFLILIWHMYWYLSLNFPLVFLGGRDTGIPSTIPYFHIPFIIGSGQELKKKQIMETLCIFLYFP